MYPFTLMTLVSCTRVFGYLLNFRFSVSSPRLSGILGCCISLSFSLTQFLCRETFLETETPLLLRYTSQKPGSQLVLLTVTIRRRFTASVVLSQPRRAQDLPLLPFSLHPDVTPLVLQPGSQTEVLLLRTSLLLLFQLIRIRSHIPYPFCLLSTQPYPLRLISSHFPISFFSDPNDDTNSVTIIC